MPKVLVCGLGQVGYRVAKLLSRLSSSIAVLTWPEARAEFVHEVEELGVHVFYGDARSDQALLDAGILDVEAVIACTDDDLTNLEIALDARRLHPGIRVVGRVFDQGLARRLEQTGVFDRALGMSVIAAPSFAAAATGDTGVGQFEWKGQTYGLHWGGEGQPIDGVSLVIRRQPAVLASRARRSRAGGTWTFARKFWSGAPPHLRNLMVGITVLTVISVAVFQVGMKLSPADALYFVITTVTTTGYGDITPRDAAIWVKLYGCFLMLMGSAGVATIYSLLTDYIVSERFKQLMGRQQVDKDDHVVVIGLGNVGFRTAAHLAEMGLHVVVIDQTSEPDYRSFLSDSTIFLAGDGRDPATLDRAAISSANGLVAATGDDAVNLSIALAAKELNPNCRVVTRMFDERLAEKVEEMMNIDAALSASRIAAPQFAAAAIDARVLYAVVAENKLLVILPPDEQGEFGTIVRPLR